MAKAKMPSWFVENYPEYKKVLWNALRAFVASFIPTLGLMLSSVTISDVGDKETLYKFLVSACIAGVAAGIIALGKYLRSLFPDSEVAQKIPI
jgi:hypothetical protein